MANCKFCNATIRWREDDGRWIPLDWNGHRHQCLQKSHQETPAEGYARGYADGLLAGLTQAKPAELLGGIPVMDLIKLTHPDLHPLEKSGLANRVTAKLLALRGKS